MQPKELAQAIQAAAKGSLGQMHEEQRLELLAACGKLKGSLETPLEASQRIALSVLRLDPYIINRLK